MISRKKKIRLVQIFLLFLGLALILFTYVNKQNSTNKIISKETKEEINKKLDKNSGGEETFYNIEYSGLDLSGNRYILKAKEASNEKFSNELINLKSVDAAFYFKDDTILYVNSDYGIYNNKTLDMIFEKNVKGDYITTKLFAEKAEYSNSKGLLMITDNVKISDPKGTMMAENLIFDINKNKLNISSAGNKKVNANINYK